MNNYERLLEREKQNELQRNLSANKRFKLLVFVILPALCLFICWILCFKMISPGYVGVVVDLLGDAKGVESKELHVGMHWISPWKTVYQFPVFEQNHTWEGRDGFSFQTREGMAVHADVGVTFHLRSECIPVIFQKYRRGMHEITHTFVRNFIRDAINKAASKMRIEDLYSEGKEAFFVDVEEHVRENLGGLGVEISRIYLIGRFHFPENVIHALNAKIEATQRAQQRENELREAEAEAKKRIAKAEGDARCEMVRAETQAKANALLAESITPELLELMRIEKWNGELPKVTGSSVPMINLEKK